MRGNAAYFYALITTPVFICPSKEYIIAIQYYFCNGVIFLQTRPLVLVQEPEGGNCKAEEDNITVIAVYSGEAPLSVATQRVFDGETRFSFPSEITIGATKTRIVYSYKPEQWKELLETCSMPGVQGGIKQVMIPILKYFQEAYPGIFNDIYYNEDLEQEFFAEIVKLKAETF